MVCCAISYDHINNQADTRNPNFQFTSKVLVVLKCVKLNLPIIVAQTALAMLDFIIIIMFRFEFPKVTRNAFVKL